MGKVKFFTLCSGILCLLLAVSVCAAGGGASNASLTLDCYAAYLMDLDTGSILYARNAEEALAPASLTKVMTAFLALEHGGLDESVTVTQSAIDSFYAHESAEFSTKADLQAGEVMSMRDLLYCVLVSSSSDACCVVAEAVSGTVEDFVALMNQRAVELGCENTHFDNPHGLNSATHYTTATDLAKITTAALQYDEFVKICNTASIEIPATNLHGMRYLKTTNYLLSSNTVGNYVYSRACGVKTGYTSQAGYCLISTAKNSRMSLLGIVMGATATLDEKNNEDEPDAYTIHSFTDMVTLFEYGFDNFTSVSLLSSLDMQAEMPVTLAAAGTEVAVLSPVRSVTTMLPAGYDESLIQKTVSLSVDSIEAPVSAGQILGKVAIYYDDQLIDTVDLAAIADVERSELAFLKRQLLLYWEIPWVKVATCAVGALFLLYLIRLCLPRKKRRARY